MREAWQKLVNIVCVVVWYTGVLNFVVAMAVHACCVKYSLERCISLLSAYLCLNGDYSEIFVEFGTQFLNRLVLTM